MKSWNSNSNTIKYDRKKENNINFRWYEIIEGIAYYYQINFNMSKIIVQLSDYHDMLSRHIQAKRVSSNDKILCSSSMREKSKAFKY